MSQSGRERIEAIRAQRKESGALLKKGSRTYAAFDALEEEALRGGELTKGCKELIATAISIIVNCEPCMEWHVREALAAGMTEKQVLEAIDIAIAMGGGPATVRARFAVEALEYHQQETRQ